MKTWIRNFTRRVFIFIAHFLLFLLAWILVLPFTIINLLCVLWTKGNVEKYFRDSAYSLDCWGGREWRTGLNLLMLKKNSKHPFGNIEEPMSSVFGKNEYKNTLRFFFGKCVAGFLNLIDKKHCRNAIRDDIVSSKVPFTYET